MSLEREISFLLNGVRTHATVAVNASTLSMLRDTLSLTGTKYACGEGECGACTILVDGLSVNACLMFAVDCDGRELVTIEGLARDATGQAVQKAFVEHGAVQCGFCTPGMVVQATHLLGAHPHASRDEIRRGIEGNLCRCTGYAKIVEAIADAGEAVAGHGRCAPGESGREAREQDCCGSARAGEHGAAAPGAAPVAAR